MDEQRTGDAAVTGVAKGALGTGTALEETQEWVIPAELQARAEEAPPSAPAPAAATASAPVAAAEPRPVVAQAPRRRSAASAGSTLGSPRTAGIAAAILLALIGVAALTTSLDRDEAGTAPQPSPQVTTPPTQAPAVDEADGGGGKPDKDKGNGKGNGNGRGND